MTCSYMLHIITNNQHIVTNMLLLIYYYVTAVIKGLISSGTEYSDHLQINSENNKVQIARYRSLVIPSCMFFIKLKQSVSFEANGFRPQ